MAFFLYKKLQDASTEAPAHKISHKLFDNIVAAISVRQLSANTIQLVTNETLEEIKKRFRPEKSRKAIKLPVREWKQNLLLSYPHKDQSSFA